mmetsp:Transcript_165843/g.403024  ORF Transcript_165843/g.403024 Transcript_165843/m.403024 type:complete len:135 (+) Transcript_165843:104-508(+)
MEPLNPSEPRKKGNLKKLGGAGGGHKNWKDRYFVLDDHLSYYDKQASYEAKKKPLGIIALGAYYAGQQGEAGKFEFAVNAYPKTLVCRAAGETEMKEWIAAINQPMTDVDKELGESAGGAGGAGGAAGGAGGSS